MEEKRTKYSQLDDEKSLTLQYQNEPSNAQTEKKKQKNDDISGWDMGFAPFIKW